MAYNEGKFSFKCKMDIELQVVRENEREKWDMIVENSPHGTIFHTWEWLKIVEKHVNMRLYPIIGTRGTTVVGIYPIFLHKRLLRSVFSPPPWVAVPYLGPVILEYEKLKQDKKESIFIEFQRSVDDFIREEMKAHYSLIKTAPGIIDARPFKWNGYMVEPIYNYVIDLRKGADFVFNQFKRNLRNDISRAEKRRVTVEEGSKDELERIYEMVKQRYKEQKRGVSTSKGYLLDLYNSLYPKNMKIFIAKHKGELVGGLINIYYESKILNWMGNVKANIGGGVSPNDLLHWEVIKWATEHGLKYYELVGANTERLCHYKSKYNPSLSICFSAKKYLSFSAKLVESAYFNILKPISEKNR